MATIEAAHIRFRPTISHISLHISDPRPQSRSMNLYETRKLVDEYLLFHYGSADEILPWPSGPCEALDFAVRTPGYAGNARVKKALDLGCAVGRSSFELSKIADEVIGIDYSHAFIDAAQKLASGESIEYSRLEEAHAHSLLTASIPDGCEPEVVSFEQGDAMHLRDDLGAFDVVHAANLLCRLPEPQKLITRLPDLVISGGTLILATPCTWLAEFTPPENFPTDSTLEWLKNSLEPHFELIEQADEPFVIRETARKFQWTVSLLTQWRRK